MQKHRLLTIFAVVFIDLLGFGLILPLLPYYAETFDASETVIGLLVAAYAAAQFIGAPILGRLSDRYGRRPLLLVSIFGTFVGFLILGAANTLWMLFISRVLDGLTGGNISIARAYITDITGEKDRAKGMGVIGAAFGLGFIIGPAVGGFLSSGERYALPAFMAAGLAGLNLLAVYRWLPETLDEPRRRALAAQERPSFSVRALRETFERPQVGPLLQIGFVFGLVFATFEGVFSLYSEKHLGLKSEQTGYLLAYVGVLVTVVQGAAIGRITARFRENQLILSGSILMAISLVGWAYAPSVEAVMVVLIPLSLSIGVLNTVTQSVLTKLVHPDEVGGILGLSTALSSLTRAIGPASGGALFDVLGTWAPGLFGAGLMVWVVFFAWKRLIRREDALLPPREGDAAVRLDAKV
jgi:DHA1 family tetracycline resistance protein-like MFS transporter